MSFGLPHCIHEYHSHSQAASPYGRNARGSDRESKVWWWWVIANKKRSDIQISYVWNSHKYSQTKQPNTEEPVCSMMYWYCYISHVVGMTLGGFSIRKWRGNSGLFSQSLRLSVRPFRSQFVRSFSIWHHHGSCEVGARPLVALTFFVKFWSGNDFDHFPIESPPGAEQTLHGKLCTTHSLYSKLVSVKCHSEHVKWRVWLSLHVMKVMVMQRIRTMGKSYVQRQWVYVWYWRCRWDTGAKVSRWERGRYILTCNICLTITLFCIFIPTSREQDIIIFF